MDYAIAFAETGHLAGDAARQQHQPGARPDHQLLPRKSAGALLMDLRSIFALSWRSGHPAPHAGRAGGRGDAELAADLDLVFKGDVSGIKEHEESRELGMQTFDQALFDLYEAGMISYEDALRNADSLNDLRLEIKLHGKDAKNRNVMAGIGNMDLVPDASNPMAANRF
jgi:twitching motility protein PilU